MKSYFIVAAITISFPSLAYADACAGGQRCGNICISWADECSMGGRLSKTEMHPITIGLGIGAAVSSSISLVLWADISACESEHKECSYTALSTSAVISVVLLAATGVAQLSLTQKSNNSMVSFAIPF